ncbi:MAG: ABC transporter ATP-binding protein/permease [Treponema sp.]|jgi:ATP-binding cassette subfamily C protein|nr:ABC transporter ATP-binding protein/permease [Treponema sp.]
MKQASSQVYIKTCETLWRYFQMEIPQAESSRAVWDEILRSGGFRYTETILENFWWKEIHGVFLGELDDGTPVVVLPGRFIGYTIYNPMDGSMTPVNAVTAKRLRPAMYTIYKTFSENQIGVGEVIRFIFSEHIGKDIVFIALFGFLTSLICALPPVITAQIFDDFVPGEMLGMISQAVIILLCFDAAQILFQLITNIGISRIKVKIGLSLEAAVLDRILSHDLTFFEENSAGEILRMVDAVSRLGNLFSLDTAKNIVMGLFSFLRVVVLFHLDAGTAWWTLIIFFVFTLFCAIILSKCFRLYRMWLDANVASESVNLQIARYAERIHDAGAEERIFAVWKEVEDKKRRLAVKISTCENILTAFLKVFGVGGLTLMFLAAAASGMSVPIFVGFASAFKGLQHSLTGLVKALSGVPEFCAVCESLKPVFSELKERGKLCPNNIKPEVEACNVSFSYGNFGNVIANNLSFFIGSGETLGIFGPTGSGKTTIAKLLLGLYEPKSGRISIGGYKNSSLDSIYARKQWGVITQENELTSINLYKFLVDNNDVEEDTIYEALGMVKMTERIRELGLNTSVESCGFLKTEMERLMTARIILKHPRLIIFDEPTDNIAFDMICSLDAVKIIMTDNIKFLERCNKIINLK